MKILSKTLRDGGYLTPKIYVPKSAWYQAGVKISALPTKSASWDLINESLLRIKELNKEDEGVARELENFCNQLGEIQNTLAKVL